MEGVTSDELVIGGVGGGGGGPGPLMLATTGNSDSPLLVGPLPMPLPSNLVGGSGGASGGGVVSGSGDHPISNENTANFERGVGRSRSAFQLRTGDWINERLHYSNNKYNDHPTGAQS